MRTKGGWEAEKIKGDRPFWARHYVGDRTYMILHTKEGRAGIGLSRNWREEELRGFDIMEWE